MARSVVFRGTERCPHCQLAPRWCICVGARTLALPFAVDVMMHNGEAHKPTSTGNLIRRVVPASRQIIYHNQRLPQREAVCLPGRELWILHPRGEPLANALQSASATSGDIVRSQILQVLLIDGTWSQANNMLRHVDSWGKKVSLPGSALVGESRYWLRKQHSAGHFSTIEALIIFLSAFGLAEESAALKLQFELHVYASLLARGHRADAVEFLRDSPIASTMPELVEKLK